MMVEDRRCSIYQTLSRLPFSLSNQHNSIKHSSLLFYQISKFIHSIKSIILLQSISARQNSNFFPHTHQSCTYPDINMLFPKFAIIGGGPGGLTVAAILEKNQIPFTVYELDPSPNERNQGGTLDLHPQGGQLAIRAAGLWDAFVKHSRPESDVMKIVSHSGEALWDGNGKDPKVISKEAKFDHRPEIDREKLKEVLLSGVEESNTRWGIKLQGVVEEGEGKYELRFKDGEVVRNVDLVVGADGAWTEVRALLSNEEPFYSGISAVEMWAEESHEKHPFVSEFVGQGSMFSIGERTIQSKRLGSGTIRTYGNLRQPESFIKDSGIDWTKPDEARKEYVEKYFGDCGADLKRRMLDSDDQLVTRTLYMLPVGFK